MTDFEVKWGNGRRARS